jgi:O-antigen ligase
VKFGALAVFGGILLLTQSRGALGALAVALIIPYAVQRNQQTMRSYLIVGGLCLCALLAFLVAQDIDIIFPDRLTSNLYTLSSRTEIWDSALRLYASADPLNMLFGFGPMLGNMWIRPEAGFITQSAHNSFLQVLLSGGIFALISYFFMFFTSWNQTRSRLGNSPNLQTLLLRLITFSFVEGMIELGVGTKLNQLTIVFAFVLAMLVFGRTKGRAPLSGPRFRTLTPDY